MAIRDNLGNANAKKGFYISKHEFTTKNDVIFGVKDFKKLLIGTLKNYKSTTTNTIEIYKTDENGNTIKKLYSRLFSGNTVKDLELDISECEYINFTATSSVDDGVAYNLNFS